jgi:hypothetical protein
VKAPEGARWLRSAMPQLAIGVALVLLVFLTARLSLRAPIAPVLPDAVSTDDVARSSAVAVRAPVGDVPEPPRRLEWSAVARASRYRVRLMEVDRREVWSAFTGAAAVDLPPEARALAMPSRTLLWDVTAYDASGGVIASSGQQAFRLVPR